MINEELAKQAHKNNYMLNDYVENSTTKDWENLIENTKETLKSYNLENWEEILERFKIKTSDWINKKNSMDAGHVSWAIAGPSNYNMKKHNKWVERTTEHMKKYDHIFDLKNYLPKTPRNEIKQNIEEKEYTVDDIKVIQNTELNRLQLEFDDKPNEEIRKLLKSNGYKWSPKNGVWQRQLTNNALYGLKRLLSQIKEV